MEKTGSINERIFAATLLIDSGRKNYTPKGYKSLMNGIHTAIQAFTEARKQGA